MTLLIIVLILWVLPIVLILKTNRTQGAEKIAWLIAIVTISWLAWVFYLLLAPIKHKAC